MVDCFWNLRDSKDLGDKVIFKGQTMQVMQIRLLITVFKNGGGLPSFSVIVYLQVFTGFLSEWGAPPRNGFLGPLRPGFLLLLLFLFFALPALFSNNLVRERPRGHVTFVREPILGHYSWNSHDCWEAMETWVCAGWVLASNGNTGVCWLGAGQQWRHGCVLVGCWPAMETWVCAGWVLASNGDMVVCLLVVDQQWRHGCVLVGCWPTMDTWIADQ